MKHYISILSLLLVILYSTSHAEKQRISNSLESRWDYTNRLGYELFLMGDKAIPYLIENLTNDDHWTRENAMKAINEFYPEPDLMSVLSVIFIHNEDNRLRSTSAHTMANIDPEFSRKLMAKHLDTDPETQRIAIDVLIELKDERVIPYLVEQMSNHRTAPERRREVTFGLADFQDKRALPELLKILRQPSVNAIDALTKSIEKTAQIDDPQSVSILLEAMDPYSDLGRRVSYSISNSVIDSMSKFGLSNLLQMLDTVKANVDKKVETKILQVLSRVKNKEAIPDFEKECIVTQNEYHKSVLVNSLSDMGQEGLESLLRIAEQNPSMSVLTALSTFNKSEAIEAIGTIALDTSSQHQLHAVETLSKFGTFWKSEIHKYIQQLLDDPNSIVRISTINIIRKMNSVEMIPMLDKLAKESKGNTRNAAYLTIDELSGKNPLDLKIQMVSNKYDYGHPTALKYTIKNTSNYPVKFGFKRDIQSSHLKLEIQQPDGTMAKGGC